MKQRPTTKRTRFIGTLLVEWICHSTLQTPSKIRSFKMSLQQLKELAYNTSSPWTTRNPPVDYNHSWKQVPCHIPSYCTVLRSILEIIRTEKGFKVEWQLPLGRTTTRRVGLVRHGQCRRRIPWLAKTWPRCACNPFCHWIGPRAVAYKLFLVQIQLLVQPSTQPMPKGRIKSGA